MAQQGQTATGSEFRPIRTSGADVDGEHQQLATQTTEVIVRQGRAVLALHSHEDPAREDLAAFEDEDIAGYDPPRTATR